MSNSVMNKDGSYTSNTFAFRSLTAKEAQDFVRYAMDNDPTSNNWTIFHPICQEVWRNRGLKEKNA